ncbi:MAG: PEP-CTERM sorting domain-containing protein [Planctomycetota bacterium]|nr:PEP-CTERM sorting domain-containing protein [Planctomycetota bacterium]
MSKTIIAAVAVAVACLLAGGPAFGALTVYISSNGSTAENTLLQNVMTARGYTVINGVAPTALGSSTSFGAADVILLNMGGIGTEDGISAGGQTNLVNFVDSGKGLVTGEWIVWNGSANTTLKAILPATSGGLSGAAQTYTRSTADTVMNEVLGAASVSFTSDNHGGSGTILTPRTLNTVTATTFYTATGGGAGVVGWSGAAFGGAAESKVVSFGCLFGDSTDASANFNQLLGNAVHWAGPAPEPATMALLVFGGLGLLARSRRRAAR